MTLGITIPAHSRGLLLGALCLLLLSPKMSFASPPEIKITGFRVAQEGESGRWEIVASEASYYAQTEAVLEEVRAQLIDGTITRVDVQGSHGRFRSAEKILSLEGNVTIRTDAGYRFTTPVMEWNGGEGTIQSKEGVELVSREITVWGERLHYSIGDRRTILDGKVRSVWRFDGSVREDD
ncbi:MAG: LPS export ABC transporter periplasmic protein LptC [bacterium]|nr:MAG: LPS export ABC transporter periplasmic protein LptC [bacterium]